MKSLSRREALVRLIGLAVLALEAHAFGKGTGPAEPALAMLGAKILEGLPDEPSRTRLRKDAQYLGPASGLSERIRRDFERGDTVSADGWILSRTEALLIIAAPA